MSEITTINQAIQFFLKHGEEAVDKYPYQDPIDPDLDMRIGGSDMCLTVAKAILPVYAACMLNYPSSLVAKTIERSYMSFYSVGDYIEINGVEPHVFDNGGDKIIMDPVQFAKRLYEGYAFAYKNEPTFESDLFRGFKAHSLFSLGIMNLAVPGVNLHAVIERELKSGKNYRKEGLVQQLDFECRAARLSDILYNIESLDHLPLRSPGAFLRQSGALHPAVMRKAFGFGFWESLINRGSDQDHNTVEAILGHLIKAYPDDARAMLLSLDFNSTDFYGQADMLTTVFEIIKSDAVEAGIQDVYDDISFKIGLLTSHLGEDSELLLESSDYEISCMLGDKMLNNAFTDLKGLGASLYETVMTSHLAIPVDRISKSHYAVWGFLGKLQHVSQIVSKSQFSRYLAHMAEAAFTLFPEGYDKIKGYEDYIVMGINSQMRGLVSQLTSDGVTYTKLKRMPDEAKDMMSMWGLDMQALGVTRGSTVEKRFGVDLGL